jgi:hypothetical protein
MIEIGYKCINHKICVKAKSDIHTPNFRKGATILCQIKHFT